MTKTDNILSWILSVLRWMFIISGTVLLISIIFAFTSAPFWAYYWLGTSESEIADRPENIILLGGSGMPGKSNLMRCWYTAHAANLYPSADIIIAMPGDTLDKNSTPRLIASELILRGIDPLRLQYETKGTNTRSQALNFTKMLDTAQPVLIVSSPEHMRRAVLTFRKAGFGKVNALPAFETNVEANLRFSEKDVGTTAPLMPDVGDNISIRYQLWNHLIYEIMVGREMIALLYYKLQGWI